MKKMVCVMICILLLCSCNDKTLDTSSNDIKIESSSPTSSQINKIEPKLETDKEIDFNATNEVGLRTIDFETVYSMCKQALEVFYDAKYRQNLVDFDKYISNENLKEHMMQMIEIEKFNHKISTSCTFGVGDIDWINNQQGEYVYLDLAIRLKLEVGEEGQGCQMLIENENGKLRIVDWYFGGNLSFDTAIRKNFKENRDPNFWNDESKYKSSLEKGREFVSKRKLSN